MNISNVNVWFWSNNEKQAQFSMSNKQNPVTSKRANSAEVQSCFTTSRWPPLCVQLYRHEYAVTLSSSSLLNVLPQQKHCYFKSPSSPPPHRWVTAYKLSQKCQRCVLWKADGKGSCPDRSDGGHSRNVQVIPVSYTGSVRAQLLGGVCDTTTNMHTQIRTHNNTCSYFSESFVVKSMITQSAIL